jgi:hypothetical protein
MANMLDEVTQGARWWASRLPSHVPQSASDDLVRHLIKLLVQRYTGHWYPEDRRRGSGYRTISYDQKIDPILVQAAESAGLKHIERLLETTRYIMFINPGEVKVKNVQNPDQFWDADVETIWHTKTPADDKSNSSAHASNGSGSESGLDSATPASPVASPTSPSLSPEASPKLSPNMSPRGSPPSVRRAMTNGGNSSAASRLQPHALPFEPTANAVNVHVPTNNNNNSSMGGGPVAPDAAPVSGSKRYSTSSLARQVSAPDDHSSGDRRHAATRNA